MENAQYFQVVWTFTWRENVMQKITSELDFLQSEYGMNYCFQSFKKTADGLFWGPCDAYSYYNEFGCFTIYHIVQRGELDFYFAQEFSANQFELLQREINLESGCKDIWSNMPRKFFGQRKIFFETLAKAIRAQIQKKGSFYGIRVLN